MELVLNNIKIPAECIWLRYDVD